MYHSGLLVAMEDFAIVDSRFMVTAIWGSQGFNGDTMIMEADATKMV